MGFAGDAILIEVFAGTFASHDIDTESTVVAYRLRR